ncbi:MULTISPECIES: DUF6591 domain-containing protein [Tenacibaculum]|uniref:DUF6591 domain-containing protein n=1 Tax=Tenacibaculum TaxID=104267 RepID=UPI001E653725|nr:DUF6591 domain-containing protein [Tenacibaculum finnmarkense]MCD8418418.1 hypothetical protein [Tenacibaculum finnmarkense genomovar finnmarkense]MCG8186742.1 hypothetical protein [Tenacibaculum finnmarkense genomovar finnmarkense]MCG8203223.1 hypothetical protein [Tenacibaculum finnmarkense genomovar finnmarkense]MCG8210650.1 hypothetical protein [Tenacibaculum finnmarkense genomovar finnmarkense]MCG8220933.1 hypothetical protein [Tenacibaculum finnmarkense genomovar finnmarkense]
MKKIILLRNLILVLGIISLISCGKNIPQEKNLKVNNVSISGNAKEFIKVIDSNYKIEIVNDKVVVPVKLELIKLPKIKNPEVSNISLNPIDKSGVQIPISYSFSLGSTSDYSKIEDLLNGKVGETKTILFESVLLGEDNREKVMLESDSFEINEANIKSNTNYSENVNSEKTSNSNNWDNVLDEYESYVDEYVDFFQKAKKGDMSALQEYPKLMEKAESLQKSLQKGKNNNSLSNLQSKRMLKIQNKMINAIK